MTVTLPPPIEPEHPAPYWCPQCGQLEGAGCHHPRLGPTGPPPIPPGQEWAAARQRRRALAALENVTAPRSLP